MAFLYQRSVITAGTRSGLRHNYARGDLKVPTPGAFVLRRHGAWVYLKF
jgi:hypothetical protein